LSPNTVLARTITTPFYARAGVPEVWLIDLIQDRVTVYRDPSSSGYATETHLTAGDRLRLAAFADVVLDVAKVLLVAT
jgi:Uma2 family endonuclease